jgi:DNA-binding transcriptional MocR family regulator
MRLSFSRIRDDQIDEGVQRLASAIRTMQPATA